MAFQPVPDPFPGMGPIPPGGSGFYPRAEELSAVQGLLRAGESVSLVGERKAGKTSFLNYLSLNLSPDEFIPVYVDAQRIIPQADHIFLGALLRAAVNRLGQAEHLDGLQAQPAGDEGGDALPAFANELLALLANRYSLQELKTFCFQLGVDYDSLEAEGKAGKARELVAFMARRNLLPELARRGRQARPDIVWPDAPAAARAAAATAAPAARLRTLQATPDQVYQAFVEDLEELRGRLPLNPQGGRRKLVWLIDEIETLQGYERTELFVFLRPIAQTDPDFRLLAAGYDVLYSLSDRGDWSPFYNAFRSARLAALNPDVARRLTADALAVMGATAPAAVVDEILRWSGRKPFYLKWLLSRVSTALNERRKGRRVDQALLGRAKELFLAERDVDQVLRHQWERHLTPQQQIALSLMAEAPHLDTYGLLLDGLRQRGLAPQGGLQAQDVIADLRRLGELAFLYDQLGRHVFTSECLREWALRNKPLG